MLELWTPDNLTPLHPDDAGALCEECDQAAAWYDTADGVYLCEGCADRDIAALTALAQRLQMTGGQHDA